MSHSELRADLARLYRELKTINEQLSERILAEKSLPAWIQGQPKNPSTAEWALAREAIVELVNDLVYQDDEQKPGSTTQLPGVIACSPETLQTLDELNQVKKAFHGVLMALDQIKIEEESESGSVIMVTLTKRALAALGLARLNRKQTCRKFISVDFPLEYAGFFWARYVPSIRLTAQQAIEQKLQPLGREDDSSDPMLQADYRLLRALPPNEYLAVINTEILHRRVNLSRVENPKYSDFPLRCQRLAYAPIFYRYDADFKMPRIRPLPADPPDRDARKKRSDVIIEATPYLRTVNVHRYNPPQFENQD